MSVVDYKGSLTVKKIDRKVLTPLDKYKPYFCPIKHTEYKKDCPSCVAIYGEH